MRYKKNYNILLTLISFSLVFWVSACNPVGVAQSERTVGEQIDDTALANEVKYKLLQDSLIGGYKVEVKTLKGVVYLIGIVNNQSEVDRAVEIASTVGGVKSVVPYFLMKNQADTIGRKVDDTVIATEVKAKLIDDPELKSTQFDVEVLRGHVLLFGVVGNRDDLNRAIEHAATVKGVREVKSFVTVE